MHAPDKIEDELQLTRQAGHGADFSNYLLLNARRSSVCEGEYSCAYAVSGVIDC